MKHESVKILPVFCMVKFVDNMVLTMSKNLRTNERQWLAGKFADRVKTWDVVTYVERRKVGHVS